MLQRFDLTGRSALVIGASQGIGAGIAVAFAEQGADVLVSGRDLARLRSTANDVERVGSLLGAAEVDVAEPASISMFASKVLEEHGAPTIIVNCANYPLAKPALDVTVDEWDVAVSVHLRAPFLTAQAFAPGMSEQTYGKIINVSSIWSVLAGKGRSVYAAAKSGLNQLTSSLAVEWAPMGIRVNAIAPSATSTPSVEARLEMDPARRDYLVSGIPLGRIAETSDLVGAAIFLASAESDFITGHTLFVDGGASSGRSE